MAGSPETLSNGRRTRSGDESRAEILRAAVQVIGRDGLPAASLAAIAREADASKAAVLYHFGSRERLLRAVASHAFGIFERALGSAARNSEVPADADPLRLSLEAVFNPEHRPWMAALRDIASLGIRDPQVATNVRRANAALTAASAKRLRAWNRDPSIVETLARAMVTTLQGHIDLWLCSGENDPKPYMESAMYTIRALAGPTPESSSTSFTPRHS